ncbi:MAG: hypothetical protein GY841_20250, partial [FCB group bacterium]|nr:hypothetical protein [FCB group bacterium]
MFNQTKVIESLYGLVGYEQPTNPDYDDVDADNLVSRSGRNYTDNPYVKIEWLTDNLDYKDSDTTQINAGLKKISESAITHICDKLFNKPDFIDRQLLYQFANNKINTDTLPTGYFVGYRIFTALEKNIAFKLTRILLEFEGTGDLKLYLYNSAQKTAL